MAGRANLGAVPTLLLVRHAQGSFGGPDYDVLSERGREQAGALAGDLERRGMKLDRIVSGSLARQRDTIAPAAAVSGRELEIDARWNEYESDEIIARHAAPGLAPTSSREFQTALDAALLAWISDESSERSWPGFRDRVTAALRELAGSLSSGQTAVVSTSGGPVAAICVELLGLPHESFVSFNRVMVNGGVTKIVTGRAGMTLVSFNEHAYLDLPELSLVTYR